jgi:putative colanic acid biosynthesis UDP-glucose lipid carrier transferase
MEPKRSYLLPAIYLVVDILLLSGVYYLSSRIWVPAWSNETFVFGALLWLIPLGWVVISLLLNIYTERLIQSGRHGNMRKITIGFVLLVGFILLVVVFGKYKLSRSAFFLFLLLDWLTLLGSAYVRNEFLGFIRSKGYSPRSTAFIGDKSEIQSLRDWISMHPERGYQTTQFIEIQEGETSDSLLGQIRSITSRTELEEIALGSFHETYSGVSDIINLAEEDGLRIYLHSHTPVKLVRKSEIRSWGPFTVTKVRQEPLNDLRARFIKRGVDLLITISVFLLVYWWFYPLIVILIKTNSKGPTVFKQKRIGKNGEVFDCLKFRTMRLNESCVHGRGQITQVGDKRITWIGRILRATNLDELPQFINVIKGEMSVAGPRPHMVEEDEAISKLLDKYKIRRFVKPGITGWAAVNGYRGSTDDMSLMQKRIDCDIYYIENWSPWLDTKILLQTVWNMLTLRTGGK